MLLRKAPKETYNTIQMQSSPGMKFDYSIAMGVRYKDKKRKEILEKLIDKNKKEIQSIISKYNIPLLAIPEQATRQDDN